jgi:diaminopimelate decarboxylase
MNIDVIREEAPLPALAAGDQVVLHPVGAYNLTQSMQFITYRPAVVLIGEARQVHVIRRAENLDYVQELEQVPDHLAPPCAGPPFLKSASGDAGASRLAWRSA